MNTIKALLVLEDGTVYEGSSFSIKGEVTAEIIFNTSLTGYQEVLTDPSYKGQMVVMTYPLIGNYGIIKADDESSGIHLDAFIVKECSRRVSNWRADMSLPDYLKKNNIIGIEGIDTRALTRRIREHGAMKAIISTDPSTVGTRHAVSLLLEKVRASEGIVGKDLVKEVTCKKMYTWDEARIETLDVRSKKKETEGKNSVVVIDCGVKYNILRELVENNCSVMVVPARTSSTEILQLKPDGVLLSNGPGDPAAVPYVFNTVKELVGKVPLFGICLGHQMLGLALGAKTYKLKFGHHGGNQPVKDLKTGCIHISVQNHGFCVDANTLQKDDFEVTHINLNDQTLEGIEHKKFPAFSVQFHPEASPGPNDAKYLFGKFKKMMENERRAKG